MSSLSATSAILSKFILSLDDSIIRNLLLSAHKTRVDALEESGVKPGRKLMPTTLMDNSLEFKQLGTLARDNRVADYYMPDPSTQVRSGVFQSKPFLSPRGSVSPIALDVLEQFPPTTNQEFINAE